MSEGHLVADTPRPEVERPLVVDLGDGAALDPALTGGKAAALARGAAAGLATLPGVVLTTALCDAVDDGAAVASHPAVREAFERAGGNRTAVVARSSSVVEDLAGSSMAGQFDSVIGVSGFDAFAAAVATVLDSRERAGAADQPIAVLVQPLMEPADLRRLVALSKEVAGVYGGPQDVEWAIGTARAAAGAGDADQKLWLLQSRPVTTEIRGTPRGPIYGPGPVAETFPAPLTELERDLWVPPLRDAVAEAVLLSGAATEADVEASDVVICVDGHVAIDLRLAGEIKPKHRWLQRLNPIPAVRRLRGAWRVGRLRGALPR